MVKVFRKLTLTASMESMTLNEIPKLHFSVYVDNGGIYIRCKPGDYDVVVGNMETKPCYGCVPFVVLKSNRLFNTTNCIERGVGTTTGTISKRLDYENNLYIYPKQLRILLNSKIQKEVYHFEIDQ
jgi:hypothetical protein